MTVILCGEGGAYKAVFTILARSLRLNCHIFCIRYLKEKVALLEEERSLEKESIQKYEVQFWWRMFFVHYFSGVTSRH